MKKQYVKPVMESEIFIANEYVAACWEGKCKSTHTLFGGDVTDLVHYTSDSGECTVKNVDKKPDRIERITESIIFGTYKEYTHVYGDFVQVVNASQ